MSYRFMRVLVFFDLPTTTSLHRRHYSQFRKTLLKEGFLMMQESVYCKLALNTTAANIIMDFVESNKPPEGLVQMLAITEKQYSKIVFVQGKGQNTTLDTDERIVVI